MKRKDVLNSLIDIHNDQTLGNIKLSQKNLGLLLSKLIEEDEEDSIADFETRLTLKQSVLTEEKFEFLKDQPNRSIMLEAWYAKKIAHLQLMLGL